MALGDWSNVPWHQQIWLRPLLWVLHRIERWNDRRMAELGIWDD